MTSNRGEIVDMLQAICGAYHSYALPRVGGIGTRFPESSHSTVSSVESYYWQLLDPSFISCIRTCDTSQQHHHLSPLWLKALLLFPDHNNSALLQQKTYNADQFCEYAG